MTEANSDIAGSLLPTTKQQAMVLLEAVELLMDLGRPDQAREVVAGASALMPKSEVPPILQGRLEFNLGNYDKALQAFRRAQQLVPRAALPRAHCGETLLFMGKVKEAMKDLNAALELEPGGVAAAFAQALIEAKDAGALPPPSAAKK